MPGYNSLAGGAAVTPEQFLGQNSLTPYQFAGFSPAEQQGIIDSYNAQFGQNSLAGTNDFTNNGMWGTGMSGMQLGKMGLGIGQLGLGFASYMDSKKTNQMNRKLMRQQYASNAESLANRRADRSNVLSVFGK